MNEHKAEFLETTRCYKNGGGGGPSKSQIKKQQQDADKAAKADAARMASVEKSFQASQRQFQVQLAAMKQGMSVPKITTPAPVAPPAPTPPTEDVSNRANEDERRKQSRRKGLASTIKAGATGARAKTLGMVGGGDRKPILG